MSYHNVFRNIALALGAALLLLLAGIYALMRFPAAFTLRDQPMRETAEVFPSWYSQPAPLTEDEAAALQWLADMTFRLPANEEEKTWNVGGSQHGVFSRRYQIAFACYAAATLAMRIPAYPGLARAILTNGVARLADRRSWSYIDTYWNKEPWFPDPCAKGNIMYSGHLLHTMAIAEALTGYSGYSDKGVELVWDTTRHFRYTTDALAETIAKQINAGDGGVTCEPGLVFFACNNHPHIGFRLLEGMGRGDYHAESDKWEKWAIAHFHATAGGGAVRLLRHEKTGLSLPRGQAGFDGWSMLWYESWAPDRSIPLQIWQEAVNRMDWSMFGEDTHDIPVPLIQKSCCSPVAVPPAANASFLDAAARACGDTVTAERLEQWLDGHFARRDNGRFWLKTHHEWRIGVTANRLIALALAQGSDVRRLVRSPPPRDYFKGLLLDSVHPSDTPVYQAWRDFSGVLHLELDGHGKNITLRFQNILPAAELADAKNLPARWDFSHTSLQLEKCPASLLFHSSVIA